MTPRLTSAVRAVALGAAAAAGAWFLFSEVLHTLPWFARTIVHWAVLVAGIASLAFLAHAVGIITGPTLNDAIANDRNHTVFSAFAGLVVAFWLLSIGIYVYADSRPPDNLDPWRVFVLYAASLFLAAGVRRPRWLYDRLRYSEGNELLKDIPSTPIIFLVIGGVLAIYALATHPGP